MKFVLVTEDDAITSAAKKAYGDHYGLKVFSHWKDGLEACDGADLLFVDLVSTLKEPGKIEGYEEFAQQKMSHPVANTVPLVVIAPPMDYELDAMVGWPNFLFAMVRRPVDERLFRQASGWV